MTEPASKENARFGEQLVAAGLALKNPPNGDGLDAEERRAPITLGFLQDVILGIASSVGKEIAALKRSVAEARQLRIDEVGDEVRDEVRRLGLEKDIAELKAALAEKTAYRELWKAESSYRRNDEVTFKGQLWQCNHETTDKPGMSGAWRLKHKRENL